MNARLPIYIGPGPNPCADAECWNDVQEVSDEQAQEIERIAASLILAQLQDPSPGHWFKFHICAGAMFSPDEILAQAVDEDDDTRDAYAELMASPAVLKLKHAMAAWFSRENAQEIYNQYMEGQK